MQGLPFTCNTAFPGGAVSPVEFNALTTSWINVQTVVFPNSTIARLRGNTAAATGNATALVQSDLSNTTSVAGMLMYLKRVPEGQGRTVMLSPSFQPSLQTHFDAPVDRETLTGPFAASGFAARASTCKPPPRRRSARSSRTFKPATCLLPIVYDLDRLIALATTDQKVDDAEWGNEPDGDIWPPTYRTRLDEACLVARDMGISLWAPAISNLDRDSLRWLEWVREAGGGHWPEGLAGISVHRYGNGTFEWPHEGFASRDEEVDRLLESATGSPYIVTEFGYPTTPVSTFRRRAKRTRYLRADLHLSEDEQADNIAKEWEFWRRRDCRAPFSIKSTTAFTRTKAMGFAAARPMGRCSIGNPPPTKCRRTEDDP